MSGLLLREDGSVLPDGLGKSFWLPHCLTADSMAGPWQADLPRRVRAVRGTHLFAEMFFGHFGHCLVDNPARLWPLATGILEKDMVESIIGQGVMGAGLQGQTLSPTADRLLTTFGAPESARHVTAEPLLIERLIIPRRIAPYQARMHPAFRQVLRRAGRTLSADEDLTGLPKRIWLSRMKLKTKRRPFTGGERLEQIMSDEFGFTVLHPETLPLSRQIAHARAATHIAGPVGSQLHLCGFSHRPGLRLLTIEPSFFRKGQTGINGNLIADIGTETVCAIDAANPGGLPKQQVQWSFEPRHEAGLRSLVQAWI